VQLRQVLRDAIERFTRESVPSPRMNSELLIMFTLGCGRAYLYAHPERELTADETSRYNNAIARRITGIPAQYITGHQEFWGLDLIVSPAVLIPRPETEHVIETVLELAKNNTQSISQKSDIPLRIIDVGTGSGPIALALAKELPSAEIHATDISSEALEVAKANAARHDLSSRIRFHQGDLLAGLPDAARHANFDFVVSNPPYVGESEEDQVQLDVRKFEPRSAVFAGPTGREVIERLIPHAE
jgi:release factor glutamine methyltransferase